MNDVTNLDARLAGPLLLLGGAGEALVPGLDWLAGHIGSTGSILLIPQAWPPSRHGDCAALMTPLFGRVAVAANRLVTASDLAGSGGNLGRHDAVYLCGGNTFALLAAMRASRFVSALDAYRHAGGIVAGNSAGAIVLGRSIHHAHDPNDVGLADCSGCDWLSGYSVWCHYSPAAHDAEIEDKMLGRGLPVVALRDESAITRDAAGHWASCPGAAGAAFFEGHGSGGSSRWGAAS